jgi:response regulator RpfG family c-di-GMP phosphodiesterase
MGIPESNISCAFDGKEAIKLIIENIEQNELDPLQKLFSLIITDFNVPNASAIEILVKMENELKKLEKPYPKVIMLTALNDPQLKDTFIREKLIHKFFNKPVQNDILEDAIKEILQI